jgi:hypothetical protein
MYVMKYRVFFWNLKSEHFKTKGLVKNLLLKMLQEKKFLELTVERIKLKIKTFRSKNSVELIKWTEIGASIEDL